MKTIFVGPNGIRAGWQFGIFAFLLFGFSKLFFWTLTSVFHYQEPDGWFAKSLALEGALSFVAALLAAWILSKIEGRQFAEYGLPLRGGWLRHFLAGLAWGLAAPVAMIVVLSAVDAAKVEGLGLHGGALLGAAFWWGLAFLLLGFAEEFAYRGYAQSVLGSGMGFWPAAILLSVIFGATHYFAKPMENWMDAVSVGLFGLFWCFTRWRTGTLWFAVGFHAMFNYANMAVFAQPNTGNHGQSLPAHLLNISYQGPEWLTGGPRGTEASAVEFVILAAMFGVFAMVYPREQGRG